jgi:hypothetical protein
MRHGWRAARVRHGWRDGVKACGIRLSLSLLYRVYVCAPLLLALQRLSIPPSICSRDVYTRGILTVTRETPPSIVCVHNASRSQHLPAWT